MNRSSAGAPFDTPSHDRAKVLVVDDNEKNLLAIQSVIEKVAEVVVANSGDAALRHLLKGEFAAILLDVYMPGMDGYETARIIRQRPQSRGIPIIFMSAVNKENDHLIRGYSMGAVDYVFKPVEPIVLQSKVAVFVELYEKTREIQRKATYVEQLLDTTILANNERLRAENELRIAEQRQAAIIQSLPIVLYLEPLDTIPRIPQFVAGDFTALTGFQLDALKHTPDLWRERLHPEDRERVVNAIAGRRSSTGLALEYRWQCADGRYKHFLDQAVLLRDQDGKHAQFAGTLLDITERKNLESQLSHAWKMDAIGTLTGGIAHDFNNLLTAVLGGLEIIERRVVVSDDQRRILARTRRAAEQGSELVRRLLAFARRQQLEPARIDIARLSNSVRDLLSHTLGGLARLDWKLDEHLGKALWPPYADESQLELALMNLIINARDAMPDGGTITVSGENKRCVAGNEFVLPAGEYVVLRIEDDGAGIPPELLHQVMEPFFTTKEVGKGTGLGLSMVHGFANQSGGALRIESELGRGTIVELCLPRAAENSATAEDLRRSPLPAPANRGTGTALRILLVDDHEDVRATTAALLADLGHEVTQASDGPGILKTLGLAPSAYDLLISDYAMPVVSGIEVIRRARELRPHLPAIIITGYAEVESIASRPCDVGVLMKPFDQEQLAAYVQSAAPRA
ncbi:MAG: response regulator [Burkholderiaceae bacterium]